MLEDISVKFYNIDQLRKF